MKRMVSFIFISAIALPIYAAFPIAEIFTDPNEGLYKRVGYFLGMFMLIFGVVIAYAYNNKIMVKAAWKGFLTVVLLFVLFVTTLFILYSASPDDFGDFLD
jgi:uncharacterized membrane protein